jgi:hypothetical protein
MGCPSLVAALVRNQEASRHLEGANAKWGVRPSLPPVVGTGKPPGIWKEQMQMGRPSLVAALVRKQEASRHLEGANAKCGAGLFCASHLPRGND